MNDTQLILAEIVKLQHPNSFRHMAGVISAFLAPFAIVVGFIVSETRDHRNWISAHDVKIEARDAVQCAQINQLRHMADLPLTMDCED